MNRNTKTYRKRIKGLAMAIQYRSDDLSIAQAVQGREPNAPTYMIEDALKYLLHDLGETIRYAEEDIRRAKLSIEGYAGSLKDMGRPKLRLVKSA